MNRFTGMEGAQATKIHLILGEPARPRNASSAKFQVNIGALRVIRLPMGSL